MKILSPAKINLFLHVSGKRPDGYHDLVTLMCGIDLYDTVSLEFDTPSTKVRCSQAGVPENDANVALRAARLFLQTLKKKEGVEIHIDKRIPVAAGLGGGSSNAAAVLLGLNRRYSNPFSRDELMRLGLGIGADVPFFIFQKPAIATGIGEKIELYQGLEPSPVLLIYPGFGVSTAEIYKNLNLGLTKCEKIFKNFPFKKQRFDVESHLCNDLETVTVSRYPEVLSAKEALLSHGAKGALMSGSGPTVFGLFPDWDTARGAKGSLSQNSRWQLYLANMIV